MWVSRRDGDNLGVTMKLERRLHHFIGPDSSKSGWDQGEEGFRAAPGVMSGTARGPHLSRLLSMQAAPCLTA